VVRLARRRMALSRLRRREPAGHDPVVMLHHLAGLPPAAVASIVDIPEAEVAARLATAGPGEAGASWASMRQPSVVRVLERSRQRAVRKRMLAAAAVAVLVVGVAVPLLRAGTPPEPAPRAATPTPTSTPPPDTPMVPGTTVYGVAFADPEHGYAVRAECDRYDCTLDVLSTVDREHWTAHRVPKEGAPPGTMGGLSVLGPDELTFDLFPPDQPDAIRRIHSVDGGRTWRRTSAEVAGSVTEIPPGAALYPHCVAGRRTCDVEIVVILPGSGRSARLAGGPRLTESSPGQFPLAGGQWWMSGTDPATHRPALAVSENDGRSWTVAAPPRAPVDSVWSVVANDRRLYASVSGNLGTGEYGILAVYRSDDGGRSWQQTGRRLANLATGQLVAAVDGSLLVSTLNGTALLSRNGGRTFTPVEPRFRGMASWTRHGYVTWAEPGVGIEFSSDGVHWYDLHLES
jgi:hypothetical protein